MQSYFVVGPCHFGPLFFLFISNQGSCKVFSSRPVSLPSKPSNTWKVTKISKGQFPPKKRKGGGLDHDNKTKTLGPKLQLAEGSGREKTM